MGSGYSLTFLSIIHIILEKSQDVRTDGMIAINIGIFSMFIGLGFTLQGFMDLIHLPVSSQRENEEDNLIVSSGCAMNWKFNAVLELKL